MSRTLHIIFCSAIFSLSACVVSQSEAGKSNTVIIHPQAYASSQAGAKSELRGNDVVKIETKPHIALVVKKSTIPGIESGFGIRNTVLFDAADYELELNRYLLQRNSSQSNVILQNLRVEHTVGNDVSGVYVDLSLYSGDELLSHSLGHYTNRDYRYRELDNHGQIMFSKVIFELLLGAVESSAHSNQ